MDIALTQQQPVSIAPTKARLWTGRILGGLAALFLLVDGLVKFTTVEGVVEAHARLGIPMHLAPVIGALELACLALYLVPRTSLLGALAFTGFLGGAVAIHVRSETPFWFPLVIAAMLWGSLALRDARVIALLRGK
ncbi:DoxX family protein [Sandaracinus amylolyticus]|uniref:Membrane protein n=1 Tax=Sandaracinus amylolyticus TaxID=927083 RepID=A0A0F6W8R7_9BACT|nr:DoxX family protein [Sandaracinus amylolyticus]AKF10362.1 membrane protein [Sandaracinus amylolyticus]